MGIYTEEIYNAVKLKLEEDDLDLETGTEADRIVREYLESIASFLPEPTSTEETGSRVDTDRLRIVLVNLLKNAAYRSAKIDQLDLDIEAAQSEMDEAERQRDEAYHAQTGWSLTGIAPIYGADAKKFEKQRKDAEDTRRKLINDRRSWLDSVDFQEELDALKDIIELVYSDDAKKLSGDALRAYNQYRSNYERKLSELGTVLSESERKSIIVDIVMAYYRDDDEYIQSLNNKFFEWEALIYLKEQCDFLEGPYFSRNKDAIKSKIIEEYVEMRKGNWATVEDTNFSTNRHGKVIRELREKYKKELEEHNAQKLILADAQKLFEKEFIEPASRLAINLDEVNALKETVFKKYVEMIRLGFKKPEDYRSIAGWLVGANRNIPGEALIKIKYEFFSAQEKRQADKNIEKSSQVFLEFKDWDNFSISNPDLSDLIIQRMNKALKEEIHIRYGDLVPKDDSSKGMTVDGVRNEIMVAMFLSQEMERVKEKYNEDTHGKNLTIPFEQLENAEKMKRISSLAKKIGTKSEFERSVKETLFARSPQDEDASQRKLNGFYVEYVTKKDKTKTIDWIADQAKIFGRSAKKKVQSAFSFAKEFSVEGVLYKVAEIITDVIKTPLVNLMTEIKKIANEECSFLEKFSKLFFCAVFFLGAVAAIFIFSPKIIAVSLLLQSVQLPMGMLLAYLCVSAVSSCGRLALIGVDAIARAYERAVYGYRDHFKYQLKDELKSTFSKDTGFSDKLKHFAETIGKELDNCDSDIKKIVQQIEKDSEKNLDVSKLDDRLRMLCQKKEILKNAWDDARFPKTSEGEGAWKERIVKIMGDVNSYLNIFHEKLHLDICLEGGAGISYEGFERFQMANQGPPRYDSRRSSLDDGNRVPEAMPEYMVKPSAPPYPDGDNFEASVPEMEDVGYPDLEKLSHKKAHGHMHGRSSSISADNGAEVPVARVKKLKNRDSNT